MGIKIEFNEQQIGILNAALVELPYRIASPLINHINQQIQEQRMLDIDSRRETAAHPAQSSPSSSDI